MSNAARTERSVLPDLQLDKLILTIPSINVSTDQSHAAPKRIQNYLCNTQGQE